MKPVKISSRNVMFTEPMGSEYDLNMGLLLGVKRNYIIDTGLGSNSVRPVLDYIGDDKKPIIVINTHCHWDHIWGNWVFADSLIISHKLCRELEDKYWDDALRDFAASIDGEVRKRLPDFVFEGRLYFPEDGVCIFHSPGHSPDSISVFDEFDGILYAGDNIGDNDDKILPWIDTDRETFRDLLEVYGKYDFDFCISGHNKPQPKSVLARMAAALEVAGEDCGLRNLIS